MKTSQEIIERLRGRAKIRRAIPRVTDGADRISDECETAAVKIEQLEADLAHWKANHAALVRRCAIYSQRPDLPVDRIPAADAYQAVIDRQAAEMRDFKRELGVDEDEHLVDILIRLKREKEKT